MDVPIDVVLKNEGRVETRVEEPFARISVGNCRAGKDCEPSQGIQVTQPSQGRATGDARARVGLERIQVVFGPLRLMRDGDVDAGQIGRKEEGFLARRVFSRDGKNGTELAGVRADGAAGPVTEDLRLAWSWQDADGCSSGPW